MGFWTDHDFEPKFGDRFVVDLRLDEDYIVKWYNIKSVDLPSFKVGSQTYNLLNREIKYPTNIKWNPIKISIVETIDNNLLYYLRNHYEGHQEDEGHLLYKHDYVLDSTISKDRSFSNNIIIKQYDANEKLLETWEIENFHITEINFNKASYEEGNIRQTEITFEYEWAYLGLPSDGEDRAKAPEAISGVVEIPEEEIQIMKAERTKEKKQPIEPISPPIDLKNPPKTKKEVQKVEQDLQKYMGTNAPNREKLKFPERRPIKPIDRMERKKDNKKRVNLTPEGRRFIGGNK